MTFAKYLPRLTIFAIVATLAAASPAAAQVMVVKSQGVSAPRFKPGSFLPQGHVLRLNVGDQVTVLDGTSVRVFKGQGVFTIGATPQETQSILDLIFRRNGERRRIASVRGINSRRSGRSSQIGPESVWDMNVMDGGAFCVAPGAPVNLWRYGGAASDVVVITRSANQATVEAGWPIDQTIAWPDELPITDGEAYQVNLNDVKANIVWRAIGTAPGDLAGLATAFEAHGCDAQLNVLRAKLAVTRPAP